MTSWLIPLSDEAVRAETAQHRARLKGARGRGRRRTSAGGTSPRRERRGSAFASMLGLHVGARVADASPSPC